MYLKVLCRAPLGVGRPLKKQLLMQLKLTVGLMLLACLHAGARGLAQDITYSGKGVSLKKIFVEIKKQSGYTVFCDYTIFNESRKVDIDVKDASVEEVLSVALRGQGLRYWIEDKMIAISRESGMGLSGFSAEEMPPPPPPIQVNGRVVDEYGQPLPGASIAIKGKNTSVLSNENGEYSITADSRDRLVFSFIGYESVEVAINNRTSVDVKLVVAIQDLDEAVVVGYGSRKRALVSGSVTSVKAAEIAERPASNLSNLLAGKLTGVSVNQSTGTPGISSEVRVRSANSWNSSSSLYVIDGVVRDKGAFDALDPNEVDDITVLKDGASVAIYGSRAANGVILITTKRGRSGKTRIQYTGTYSADEPTKIPEVMGIYETALMANTVFTESQPWGYFSPEDLAHAKTINGGYGYDWYDIGYQTPYTNRHALSISGGSEKIQYYLGGSYFNESGYLPNVKYDRYNIRANITAEIATGLTANVNLATEYGNRQRFNFTYDYGSNDLNNLWGKLLYYNALTPFSIDGNPVNPGWLGNPIEMMRNGGYWRNSDQRIDALLSLEYEIPGVKGLAARVSFSKNTLNSYTKSYAKKQLLYNYKTTGPTGKIYTDELLGTVLSGDPGTEYLSNSWGRERPYQLNGQLSYKRDFGKHHIDALAVYEQFENNFNSFAGTRHNFPVINTDQFFATSSNNADWSLSGGEIQDARISYLGRIGYDFDEKYILTASLRRDGSVKFAPNQRWGWFPAVSAAWRLSEEDFFLRSGLSDRLNEFKLRASYGLVGNDAIGGWAWQERYNASGGFFFGSAFQQGIAYSGTPSLNLSWEKSRSYDFGFDARLFDNFVLNMGYWFRNTFDILGVRVLAIPSTVGASMPAENYGKVNSNGLEIELAYLGQIGADARFRIKGNFAYATNKVIFRDVAQNTQEVDNPNGKSTSYMVGYVATDIIRTQTELDKLPAGYTIMGYAPTLGMLNYQDLSGPGGSPDGKIDSYDRAVISSYTGGSAPYTYGLTLNGEWKGLSVEIFFQGSAGFKKMYNDGYNRNSLNGGNRSWAIWSDYWTPDNTDARMPKPADWDASPDRNGSTFWTWDGSFVRLKYVNLAYSLPASLIGKAGLEQARLFVAGSNLLTFSKFKWYDPEIGSAMSYPNVKTLIVGLTLGL